MVPFAHCLSVLLVFVMPIGLENIGWKMYMINGSWDIIIVVLIVGIFKLCVNLADTAQAVYWVETKGKTLEEVDAIFEGQKHSSVPDVENVRRGKATVDVAVLEKELHDETGIEKKLG